MMQTLSDRFGVSLDRLLARVYSYLILLRSKTNGQSRSTLLEHFTSYVRSNCMHVLTADRYQQKSVRG